MPRHSRRTRRRRRSRRGGRKPVPWAGWGKLAPHGKERTIMLRNCGRKCFLGPKKSFPICAKGTCKVNKKGLHAAYIRARQWGKPRHTYRGRSRPRHRRGTYRRIARRARSMLKRRVGASSRRRHGGKRRRRRRRSRRRALRRQISISVFGQ